MRKTRYDAGFFVVLERNVRFSRFSSTILAPRCHLVRYPRPCADVDTHFHSVCRGLAPDSHCTTYPSTSRPRSNGVNRRNSGTCAIFPKP